MTQENSKERKLTKKEVEKFRMQLIALRDQFVANIEHRERGSLNKSPKDASGDLSGYSFHMADVATDNFDTEINLGLASNSHHILMEVDDALKRIEDGTYGICEKYKLPIGRKRLEVMPYARFCIKAQEEEEHNARLG